MKMNHKKLTVLLLALLLALSTLTACGGQGGETDTSDTAAENGTVVSQVTDPETDPETQAPVLDEAAAKALLSSALTASEAKTVYANTVQGAMSTEGVSMMDVAIYEATDGNGHMAEFKALGMSISYVILDGKAYVALGVGDTYTDKYAVPLTAEQTELLLSSVLSADMQEGVDISFMMSAEAFVGLSGEGQADGSVLLTATDLTAEAKANMDGGDGSTVTITTCTMTVSADGLLTGIDFAATITIPETDFSAAMTREMSVTQTTVYDNVTITAPEDADAYVEESYEAVFEGTVPMNSLLSASDMPLDGDHYVINMADADKLAAQGQLLAEFPHLYAGKSFVLTVSVSDQDISHYATIGDSLVFLDYTQEVLGPLDGDVITANAILDQVVDGEENDLENYCFYFESYELVERAPGPNGGTYMFVDVNSSLNVRTAPTTAGNSPIAALLRGDVVEVLEIVDGWAKITFEEAENGYAYVSADYLSHS